MQEKQFRNNNFHVPWRHWNCSATIFLFCRVSFQKQTKKAQQRRKDYNCIASARIHYSTNPWWLMKNDKCTKRQRSSTKNPTTGKHVRTISDKLSLGIKTRPNVTTGGTCNDIRGRKGLQAELRQNIRRVWDYWDGHVRKFNVVKHRI